MRKKSIIMTCMIVFSMLFTGCATQELQKKYIENAVIDQQVIAGVNDSTSMEEFEDSLEAEEVTDDIAP